MEITTLGFLAFLGVTLVIYYNLSNCHKWKCILVSSIMFVATYKPLGLVFIFLSSWLIWWGANHIEKNFFSNNMSPEQIRKKNKRLLFIIVTINLGILLLLKYIGAYVGQYRNAQNVFSMFIPVGLSYYTLQAVGYTLDVYWKKIHAEKSFSKTLLFLTYFPQMIQGPISRYKDLSHELFEKNDGFHIINLKHGVQMMLWGYLKVLVLGARIATIVEGIFYGNVEPYGWTVLIGFTLFGLELYCNFSGGIDIVRGVSQCFDINLPENFTQPFFSKSLGEFWRRWHITLGSWMKDYVFFPLSMSKAMSTSKKKFKKVVSNKTATRIVMAISNIMVFLIVGIWHGNTGNYALWGLYNGLVLAGAELLTPVFIKTKSGLHINEKSKVWSVFCVIRTFMIVTLGWCTDCASTFTGSLHLLHNMFAISKTNLNIISCSTMNFLTIFLCTCILAGVDIMHENRCSVRNYLDKKPFVVQMLFWILVIQFIALFRKIITIGGFIYAQY